MNKPDDHRFYDDLLQILCEAPRTQIDEDIVADIKKFMSEQHTIDEKYEFIQTISREPLNMISDNVGVGRITPFVQLACDLDKMFQIRSIPEVDMNTHPVISAGIPVSEEPIFSAITVQYIIDNQDEDIHCDTMTDIFGYMDDLMWAGKFDVVDEFILEFCEKSEQICFQYHVTMLTCAHWVRDKLNNRELLIAKSIAAGERERHDREEVLKILHGLI